MNFSQVQWAEVSEEWLVDKVVVDAEIKGVGSRLWRIFVRDPIESPWDDLDGLVVVNTAFSMVARLYSVIIRFFHILFCIII